MENRAGAHLIYWARYFRRYQEYRSCGIDYRASDGGVLCAGWPCDYPAEPRVIDASLNADFYGCVYRAGCRWRCPRHGDSLWGGPRRVFERRWIGLGRY